MIFFTQLRVLLQKTMQATQKYKTVTVCKGVKECIIQIYTCALHGFQHNSFVQSGKITVGGALQTLKQTTNQS